QDFMVQTLDQEFMKAGKGWEVVKKSANQNVQEFFSLVTKGNLKTAGKQFGFEIANIPAIKRALKEKGATTKTSTPKAAVDALRSALVEESVAESRGEFIAKISDWIRSRTKEEIDIWDGLSKEVQTKLKEVKDIETKLGGVATGQQLIKAIEERLTPQRAEGAFRATYAAEAAERKLTSRTTGPGGESRAPLVRQVAIPAARVTPTGGTIFETARGSQRAIPQFATFKTGFEKLFEELAAKNALIYDRRYPGRIA
ncbi:unnamed protein product, partial [marine sediment metagenome]